jgi:hypothetical protein
MIFVGVVSQRVAEKKTNMNIRLTNPALQKDHNPAIGPTPEIRR